MSKIRDALLVQSDTKPSSLIFGENSLHSNISSIITNLKPKVVLHLGSISHAIGCGHLLEKGSELLYAKSLVATLEDWISPQRHSMRKDGIPNLHDAYTQYIEDAKLDETITLLNSDLSVISELFMAKEIVPDLIILDENFGNIDPTIFTRPLSKLPVILQDFSSSNTKRKGQNNLLLNSEHYENVLLRSNFTLAADSLTKILKLLDRDSSRSKSSSTRSPKTTLEKKDTTSRAEKRKKLLEEKARLRAEKRQAKSSEKDKKVTPKAQITSVRSRTAPAAQQAAAAPQQAAPAPQQAAPAPQQAAPAPQQAAAVPQQAVPAPQQAAPVPQQAAPAPQQAVPAPQQAAAAPQQAQQAVPSPQKTIQRARAAASQQAAPVPQQARQTEPQQAMPQHQTSSMSQQMAPAPTAMQKPPAPMPTQNEQEEVIDSAKRALLQKRLRERLGKRG